MSPNDSLAEWSKAPDLGSGPKGRGFKSHSCHKSVILRFFFFFFVFVSLLNPTFDLQLGF